jgi:hypothetical protein
MCIKIVTSHDQFEFDPSEPLEYQVKGAREVVIDYSPDDSRIQSFIDQMDRIVKNGVGCQMNIKVNSNNSLKSYQFERQVAEASRNLEVNEAISMLVRNHKDVDKRLENMTQLCLKSIE